MLPLVQSRIIWGVFSIVLILTFTSGFMWNRIKNAPYIGVTQGGTVSWIAGGYQNQLGIESQVVGGVCKSSSCEAASVIKVDDELTTQTASSPLVSSL